MTAWLRLDSGTRFIKPPYDRLDLDRSPSPAIMAHGVGGVAIHQHWIEIEADGRPRPPMLDSPAKPPYRVPSMATIAELPPNGFTVASTFSGCGGSCLGYRMAGFRVAWASEFIPAAQQVYRLNHPTSILDTRDIRRVQPAEVLTAIGLRPGELDVLDGSPPCASFSTAGKREASWGKIKDYSDTRQRTDDLFFEYARLLEGIRPRVFVAENVSGLVKGTAKGYFLEILARLKACGYRVAARLLDAQWLGVPQSRQRLIFIGVREDLGLDPVHPAPLPYRYSVREAVPWIDRFSSNTSFVETWKDARGSAAHTILASDARNKGSRVEVDSTAPGLGSYAIAAEWDKLGPGEASGKFFNLIRPHPDRPCPTVTGAGGNPSAASVTHPIERRKFSIAELRRICGFPDDFLLTGTFAQQWERLGRSVPPVMMSHVAATLRDKILCQLPTQHPRETR